jgi:hypothetical protein
MRVWLLTTTTYANWLPGDSRGSVASVRDRRDGESESTTREEHDLPGEPYDVGIAGLWLSAAESAGEPVHFALGHAEVAAAQFRATAAYRGWDLLALAVLFNHVHLVVRVEGDPEPRTLLADFKAYASRALNAAFGRQKWWTTKGSKRKLGDARAVAAGVNYVLHKQWRPLVTWPLDEPATTGEPRASATGDRGTSSR